MRLAVKDLQALRARAKRGNLTDTDRRWIADELLDDLLDIAIHFKQEEERLERALLRSV